MNENLRKSIVLYATDESEQLERFLRSLSRPTLESLLIDLMTMYYNDKNSSRLRELSAIYIAGYKPTEEKLGYNGYMQHVDKGIVTYCEVKPKNTDSRDKKLNGGGSFNDYTPERFERDMKENPKVLTCGFVHGKLIYLFEFDFLCLKDRLYNLIKRRFPDKVRRPGEYLRSASFSIRDYRDCSSLKAVFLRKDIERFYDFLSRDLIEAIEDFRRKNAQD
ncbi:MAG: hypothetical protein ACK42C_00590 [Aquificaceae bacterium]|jgi:hypothetical protein|uniref:hypothetical protein n=1 Tax=Hydrogenobacter sp. Uz 6-8 TaxID=3384828 RepID=UPI0038FCED59